MKSNEIKKFREDLLNLSAIELLKPEIKKEIIKLLVCLGDLKTLIRLPKDNDFDKRIKRNIRESKEKAEKIKNK